MDGEGLREMKIRNSLTVVCGMGHYLVDRTIFGPSLLFCSKLFWWLFPFGSGSSRASSYSLFQFPAPLPTNKHNN